MNYLWRVIETIMALVGGLLILGGVGTSDYYVMELGQNEPSSVWVTIFIGFILIIPAFIDIIRES